MTDEIEYHSNKKPEKTYISKSIKLAPFGEQAERRIRIASKVFDSPDAHCFAMHRGELVIRVTDGGRQEIIAKFYEDNRGVFVLTIQRFSQRTGKPHKTSFSFCGEEIPRLLNFISSLRFAPLSSDNGLKITDGELKKILLSPRSSPKSRRPKPSHPVEFARSGITESDLVAIGYRKKQLARFEKLLFDPDYFESEKRSLRLADEALWQAFFERNKWIFGYGLTYVFLSSLADQKLEQVVSGYDFSERGNRADMPVSRENGSFGAIRGFDLLCPEMNAETHYGAVKKYTRTALAAAPNTPSKGFNPALKVTREILLAAVHGG